LDEPSASLTSAPDDSCRTCSPPALADTPLITAAADRDWHAGPAMLGFDVRGSARRASSCPGARWPPGAFVPARPARHRAAGLERAEQALPGGNAGPSEEGLRCACHPVTEECPREKPKDPEPPEVEGWKREAATSP